jgi:hypothetical protein
LPLHGLAFRDGRCDDGSINSLMTNGCGVSTALDSFSVNIAGWNVPSAIEAYGDFCGLRNCLRGHGPAWRKANAGHVSLGQLKVMSAIESCRTAALGGHVARCEKCSHMQIAYNSATGIARCARAPLPSSGLPSARLSYCRCPYVLSPFMCCSAQNRRAIQRLLRASKNINFFG